MAKPAQPEIAAVWVDPAALKGWEKNPRKHDERGIAAIMASIKRFGFGAPVVAREADGEIIAGHGRVMAAIRLKLPQVPVRYLRLDPVDAHLLSVADNRITELSETDGDLLAAVLREAREAGADIIDGVGFSEADIARMLDESTGGATGGDPGEGRYASQYGVIVICSDEAEQERVFEQLKGQGFHCRIVVT